MKYTLDVTCPVCKEGSVTLGVEVWPGTYYDPPEHNMEVVKQSCECDLSDEYEALNDLDTGPPEQEDHDD